MWVVQITDDGKTATHPEFTQTSPSRKRPRSDDSDPFPAPASAGPSEADERLMRRAMKRTRSCLVMGNSERRQKVSHGVSFSDVHEMISIASRDTMDAYQKEAMYVLCCRCDCVCGRPARTRHPPWS